MKSGMSFKGLTGVLGLLMMVSACATEVGDIDRTSPDKIRKADLKGYWYYAATVIEAPVPSPVTFDGEMAYFPGPTKVIFDVQEDFLVVYPTAELIAAGSEKKWHTQKIRNYWDEGKSDEFIEIYVGQPIAAFRISKHFDVIRQYNSQTGDQGNVIIEDTSDNKWFEREYIRVDWSSNTVKDLMFLAGTGMSGVDYYVQEYETDNPDRFELDEQAINIVTKVYLEPSSPEACSVYLVAPTDCVGAVAKVRHSFLKVDPNADYVPLRYDQVQHMENFGFFLTERNGYDEEEGLVYSAKVSLINRWNMWKNSRTGTPVLDEVGKQIACTQDVDCEGLHEGKVHCWLEDGWFSKGHCVTWDSLPPHERAPKTIRYWISPDWPAELMHSAYEAADQWDSAFKDAVAWAQFYSEKGLYDVKYCETNQDCTSGAILDTMYQDTHPRYCDPAAEKVAADKDKLCLYLVPSAEKANQQCTDGGVCGAPVLCGKNSPCPLDQACLSGICHTCPAGNCDPKNPTGWEKQFKVRMDKGAFTLYWLRELVKQDDGKGKFVEHFRRGVDDWIGGLSTGETRIALAHLNQNVGEVKILDEDGKSVCLNADGSDMLFPYQKDELFATKGCKLTLPLDDKKVPQPMTRNFTVVTKDGIKIGQVNFVHMFGQSVHTLALVGDENGNSHLLNGVATTEDMIRGGMRLAHAIPGQGAVDFSVTAALSGRGVRFGQFTKYAHITQEDNRVVVLPAGANGEITCYRDHAQDAGVCTGWRPELNADDMKRVKEILDALPPMFAACENVYTGDSCSEEERGDMAQMNDCRYWYKKADGEWANPCGEVEGAQDMKKHGDLRYSSYYWISEDQTASPLGYGPSAADPDTGEIYYGIANIYGAPMISYGQYAKDLLDAAKGKLTKGNIMSGDYIAQYIQAKGNPSAYESLFAPLPGKDAIKNRVERIKNVRPPVHRFWMTAQEQADFDALKKDPEFIHMMNHPKETMVAALNALPPSMSQEQLLARFGKVKGSWLENLMITEEVKQIAAGGSLEGMLLSPEDMKDLSPLSWASPDRIQKERDRLTLLAEHGCYYAQEMAEPNVYATALSVQEFCKDPKSQEFYGGSEDECQVWEITKRMLDGVLEHEIGHTVGLRHNMAASTDIFNYNDKYYDIREQDYRTCTLEGNNGCFHGDTCKLLCSDDKDCMPGTVCTEVAVEGEEGPVKACVNEHMEPQGWCWGIRKQYKDCTTDADCTELGTARCRIKAEEKFGKCEILATVDALGVCPTGTFETDGVCLSGDYCVEKNGKGQCALDGSRSCDPKGAENTCAQVFTVYYKEEYAPIKGFNVRPGQTESEILQGRSEYTYSTLMDYGGTINFDIHGIGKHDRAAIRFGYAELADAYVDTDRMYEEMEDVGELWGDKFGWSGAFMDSEFWPDFYWWSPFFYLEDFLGVKENKERVPVPFRKAYNEKTMLLSEDRGLYDLSYRLVPWVMQTDMWVGSLGTYTFDIGADLGEIMDHSWNKLMEYYVFDAFKRERWGAFRGANPLGYFMRIRDRWMPPLEDSGRFGAMFRFSWRAYPSFMPILYGNSQWMARWDRWAEDALKKLSILLFTVKPGSYKVVDEGLPTERLANFDLEPGRDGSQLDVPIGPGKFPYTTFWKDAGYYYFDHAAFIGSFWEKLAALGTMTYAMGYFMGDYMGEQVDVGVGSSIGFNTVYYTQLTNLLAGFITGDMSRYAPYVEDGKMQFTDPLRAWEGAGLPRVETSLETLAMKAYVGMYGFAFMPSGFDPGFVDSFSLCLKGNGSCWDVCKVWKDGVCVEALGEGEEADWQVDVIEFADPWTKKTYVARTTNYDPERINAAYELLQQANELKAEWEAATDDVVKQALAKRLNDIREVLDMIYTFNELYGYIQF